MVTITLYGMPVLLFPNFSISVSFSAIFPIISGLIALSHLANNIQADPSQGVLFLP